MVVPTYVLIRVLGPPLQRVTRGRQERLAQVNSHLEEMVIAHPMVQIFNLQRFMRRRMSPEVHEFRRVEIRGDFLRAVFEEASDIADLLHFRLVLPDRLGPGARHLGPGRRGGHRHDHDRHGHRLQQPDGPLRRADPPPRHHLSAIAVAAARLRRIEEVLSQEPRGSGHAGGTAEPPAVREGIAYEG